MLGEMNLEAMSILLLNRWPKSLELNAVNSLAIAVLSVLFFFLKPKGQRKLDGVHTAGLQGGKRSLKEARKAFVSECGEMMMEGYETTNGGFFYVPSPVGERLMIPTRYIEELKNAPDSKADFTASFLEMFIGKYTTIGLKWHLHPDVVKNSLNKHLDAIMPEVSDEIYQSFDDLFPPCDDWTPVVMADKFVNIISRASNRMMGGVALSRNAAWTATSINFTTDTFLAAQRLKQFHPLIRPLVAPFLPELARVRAHGAVARRTVAPLVEQRLRSGEKPLDLLQMLWDGARGRDRTPDFMAYTALAISFAAVQTSSSVPTHLLYDLCAHPEYIEPLRAEIVSVLAQEGGRFTKAAINKLVKLDSFMKESQRFNPLSYLTFGRYLPRDLTLSDGIKIPAGTIIAVPAHAISHDPKFYESPSTFDGFRFVPKIDSSNPQQQQQPKFVTTNASNLSWGYGRHACSGRFFAANEIKVIIAVFLMRYDFKFAAGQGRPKNFAFELQSAADPTAEILLRRRPVGA